MIPGLLLTGGRSRRMGRDKATLLVDGEMLAARVARVLTTVCDPVVEVGDGVTGLPSVREDPPFSGPLAALVAGARRLGEHGRATPAPLLLVACDLPNVTAPLLDLLAHWPGDTSVVPVLDGSPQYACARVGAATLAAAGEQRAAGSASLHAAFAAAGFVSVPESRWRSVAPAGALDDLDDLPPTASRERSGRPAGRGS